MISGPGVRLKSREKSCFRGKFLIRRSSGSPLAPEEFAFDTIEDHDLLPPLVEAFPDPVLRLYIPGRGMNGRIQEPDSMAKVASRCRAGDTTITNVEKRILNTMRQPACSTFRTILPVDASVQHTQAVPVWRHSGCIR